MADPTLREVEILPVEVQTGEDAPLMGFAPTLRLQLDEDESQKHVQFLLEEIDRIESERAPLARKIKSYRNQYEQQLKTTYLPWPGAFALNAPVTTQHVDTAMAEAEDVFEQVEPHWTIQGPPSPAPEVKAAIQIQQDTLDVYEDLVLAKHDSKTQARFDAILSGTGWVFQMFVRDWIDVCEIRTWHSVEQFAAEFPDTWDDFPQIVERLQRGESVTRKVTGKKEIRCGPYPEHVEWEDALVPMGCNGIDGLQDIYLSGRRIWYRWWQIQRLEEQSEDYEREIAEQLRYALNADGSINESETNPAYLQDKYETFELVYWMMYKGQYVRTLWHIERSHRLVLRAILFPYHHQRNPLIPYYIQRPRRGIYGVGLAEKLQPVNVAMMALLSHVLNAGVLTTSISLKVRENTGAAAALQEHQWYPGAVLELMNENDVSVLQMPITDLRALIELYTLLEASGEKITGLNATLAGQTDPEDKDAPGNKTAMLLRKSERKLRRYIATLKQSEDELGYQSLRLIAQFYPTDRIAAYLGRPEADVRAALAATFPIAAHAAAFDVDRLVRNQEDRELLAILLKEPLVVQDAARRWKLYERLAETRETWKGFLAEIRPSDEEFRPPPAGANGNGQGKGAMLRDRLTQRALASGMDPAMAEELAERGLQHAVSQVGAA